MNAKLVLVGGLVHFVVMQIVGMFGTGFVIHGNILKQTYKDTASFWLPALQKDPPDMAALMPHWMLMGLLFSLIVAFLYGKVRGSFDGPGWKKGLVFGFGMALFAAGLIGQYTGVFNLPNNLWAWWVVDTFIVNMVAGAALGWAAGKWAA